MRNTARTATRSRTGRAITLDLPTATICSATNVEWKNDECLEGFLFALLLKQRRDNIIRKNR